MRKRRSKKPALIPGVMLGIVVLAAMLLTLNALAGEPAPTIQAKEVDSDYVPWFRGPVEDGPALHPNHPPIDEIPPIPMPYPEEQPPAGRGEFVTYNAETGEQVTYPNDAKLTGGFAQGGGYDGADGGKGGTEVLPATFVDMIKIANYSKTGNFPWRMNCKLVMRFEDGGGASHWYVASGSMRDGEAVLTAGHCVYSQTYGWAKEIWVYPGWDGSGWGLPPANTVGAYGWGHSTYFGSWTGWTQSGNFDNDVGIIEVTRAVGFLTGWFGWSYGGSCSWHQSQIYHNASYPAENCPISGLHNGLNMYFWYGNIADCPNNQLQLNTGGGNCYDTVWGGMSGSGMYYKSGSGRYVHVICSTSNRDDRGYYCRQWQDWVNWCDNTFIPHARGSSFDLQPLDCNAEPSTILPGHTTTLLNHLAVNPTNGTDSGTWTFRVYLSTNSFISTADTLLSTQYYSWSFGTMSSVRINMVQVTIPVNTPPGNYWIGVLYDNATDGNTANNNTEGWDSVPITVPALLDYYTFSSTAEGWQFAGQIPPYDAPNTTSGSGRIGLSANGSTNCFSYWYSPDVQVEDGKVYRARWTVGSSAATNSAVSFRLRVNQKGSWRAWETSVNSNLGHAPSSGSSKDYDLYFSPTVTGTSDDDALFSFDIMSFDPADNEYSWLYLQELRVEEVSVTP
ncbi:hypothetical protein J7M23_01805 [Candidatus Sumerlaeota bacterium]|nr:hypothetical protein [Candidatus Sumerlaeota bacterium]